MSGDRRKHLVSGVERSRNGAIRVGRSVPVGRIGVALICTVIGGCRWISSASAPTFVDASEGLPRTGEWRQRLAVADLDGDGRMEIIAPPSRKELESRPHVWSNDGKGSWKEVENRFPERSYDYGDVVAADFDRDKRMDLAFAMHGIGVVVFRAEESGEWKTIDAGLPGSGQFPSRSLAAGDFDGDGWTDLVTMAEMTSHTGKGNTGVRFYRNLEGRGWRSGSISGVPEIFGDRIVAASLSGNEAPAVLFGSLVQGHADVIWQHGAETWVARAAGLPNDVIFWDLAHCDVDGDGDEDLFVAVDGPRASKVAGPRFYRLDGESWVDGSEGLPKVATRAIAAGRLRSDAPCTLAVANVFNGEVRLYQQSGAGEWKESPTVLPRPQDLKGNPYALVMADVDADQRADLIINFATEPEAGGIQVWRQQG